MILLQPFDFFLNCGIVEIYLKKYNFVTKLIAKYAKDF